MKRNVAIFTGGRADYDLVRPLCEKLIETPGFSAGLLVGGSHFSARFGNLIASIESDRIPVLGRFDVATTGDDSDTVCTCMAETLSLASKYFMQHRPDFLVVLGDRFEMLAVAQAAFMHSIPIVHIHGGEVTHGAQDDSIRHAVTKFANWHMVSTEAYRTRVIQMGEQPDTVFVTGAPGLDNILSESSQSADSILQSLGLEPGLPLYLATIHPETHVPQHNTRVTDALLVALEQRFGLDVKGEANIIFTYPNQDRGHMEILELLERFVSRHSKRTVLVKSLGMSRYLGVMRAADLVLGNSSSGIIEAPSFGVPSIDIGVRQEGRIRAESVLSAGPDSQKILEAIEIATDAAFRSKARSIVNPYGDGKAADRIIELLAQLPLGAGNAKHFYDIEMVTPISGNKMTGM